MHPDTDSHDVEVVLATFPDEAVARDVVGALLEARLIACANLVPGALSLYRWEGAIQEDAEWLGVLKTTRARLPEVEACLIERHPYDTPELISLPASHVEPRYAAWLGASTRGSGGGEADGSEGAGPGGGS